MWTKIMTNPAELEHEALAMFQDWLDAACKTGLHEPTAMTLATANAQGRPSARTVLLKSFDERGFVFFTNSQSRKGVELRANAFVSLCFFWQPLMRQVRIEGRTVTVSAEESDAYWESRPRDTQLGAWASQQSRPLDFRETLEKRMAEVHARFLDDTVPRPPYWIGYRVIPERIEFWKSGWHRLHERVLYEKHPEGWRKSLLFP
jgi:pyridoxamine 5'-phosphate oxidase